MRKWIEYGVVITIILILSLISIKFYKNYTVSSKEEASKSQFSEIINLINKEIVKCSKSIGSESYVWGEECSSILTNNTNKEIANFIVNELKFENPYNQEKTISNNIGMPAFIYTLDFINDPIENGDVVIACDIDAKSCIIRSKPGNDSNILSAVLTFK